MKITTITKESIAGTMKLMRQDQYLLESFKRESYLRNLATQLKKDGYLFAVSRQSDGVKVICLQSPIAES